MAAPAKLNGNTALVVTILVLGVVSTLVLGNMGRSMDNRREVAVVAEREDNHFRELTEDLCRIEQKLDRLLERGE